MIRPTINIITLGCSKNVVDSEKLIKQLEVGGYTVLYDSDDNSAEIVIINTCGFINDAKEESINTILRYVKDKKKNKIKKIFVTGCLSERYSNELSKEIPEVDKYYGVNSLSSILEELKVELDISKNNNRTLTGPGHYAYLKVSEGCDRFCSFCAIPIIRGKCISLPIEELVEEATILSENGVKELILIAQDLSYYGVDLYKKQMLPVLVSKLASLNKFEWIRLHYLYPANFQWELIDVIKENPSICRYIDIPIQHITDSILSSMRRSHNRKETEKILRRLRQELPDVVIRTTLITGYPGETEEDYNQLLDFVRDFKFDRLGVFPYSHEDGTWAYLNYEDDISQEIKDQRVSEIMEIQEKISAALNEKRVGTVIKTIIDRMEGDYYVGRTEFDSPEVDQEVLISKEHSLAVGNFYDIKIIQSSEFDLFGSPVN